MQNKKKVEKIRSRLTKGARDFGDACQNAVHVLMNEKGKSHEEGVNIVDNLIKQSMPYVNEGLYEQSIAGLEMIIYS